MALYWHQTGPLMKFEDGTLYIEDLNPEVKTRWRMSRIEMLRLGWRCIVAGLGKSLVRFLVWTPIVLVALGVVAYLALFILRIWIDQQ